MVGDPRFDFDLLAKLGWAVRFATADERRDAGRGDRVDAVHGVAVAHRAESSARLALPTLSRWPTSE